MSEFESFFKPVGTTTIGVVDAEGRLLKFKLFSARIGQGDAKWLPLDAVAHCQFVADLDQNLVLTNRYANSDKEDVQHLMHTLRAYGRDLGMLQAKTMTELHTEEAAAWCRRQESFGYNV